MGAGNGHRRLTLFVTLVALISNVALVGFYHRLPDDPLHLAWHLSIYSYFAILLSSLGFYGAKRGNATCVTIFANYLFIDIVICTIPRLVAITFFPEMRDMVCSSDSIYAFLQTRTESTAIARDETVRLEMQGQCRRVVGVLQALVAILAVGATAIQIILALRVSAHAGMLQREEDYTEAALVLRKIRSSPRSRSSSNLSIAEEKRFLSMKEKVDEP